MRQLDSLQPLKILLTMNTRLNTLSTWTSYFLLTSAGIFNIKQHACSRSSWQFTAWISGITSKCIASSTFYQIQRDLSTSFLWITACAARFGSIHWLLVLRYRRNANSSSKCSSNCRPRVTPVPVSDCRVPFDGVWTWKPGHKCNWLVIGLARGYSSWVSVEPLCSSPPIGGWRETWFWHFFHTDITR